MRMDALGGDLHRSAVRDVQRKGVRGPQVATVPAPQR